MGNSGDKMENIIIIGAGPAGISAALYAVRGNLNPLLINNGIGALAKAEKIENYYGLERPLSGEELYEIKKDIHCLKNVAGKKNMQEDLSRLRLILEIWQESVGDIFPGEELLKRDDGRFSRPLGK